MSMVGVPVGTVLPYVGLKNDRDGLVADGWLYCDGTILWRQDYGELFEAIGVTFGGDGDHFHLPDLRGLFLRGVDDGANRDPDVHSRRKQDGNPADPENPVGTVQGDEFAKHHHFWNGWKNCDDGSDKQCWARDWDGSDREMDLSDTGGNETRPKNVAVWYIIKAKP